MKKVTKLLAVLKWILGIAVAIAGIYFGYQIYSWVKLHFTLTIPTTPAQGKTLVQTQQEYLAKQVPPPISGGSNVSGLITTDNLTWVDKAYLYLDSINIFKWSVWTSDK